MKRLVALALCFLFIGGAGAETPEEPEKETETVYIICTPGETVNIRARASTHSPIVGRFECGYSFETDGAIKRDNQGRRWVHMVNATLEVDDAWVCESYVQQTPVTISKEVAVVDARGRVSVRSTPNGKRRKWVQPGEQVNVLAYSDEWVCTDIGYIAIDCLLFTGTGV